MKNKYYITTTLPYVNAKPHIGFALEIVQADTIARYKEMTGHEVFFNFGTDEHGQKIYQRATEEKMDPQSYVDDCATKFSILKDKLNLTYNNFIRTTDPHHKYAAQEIWKRCEANGYIGKGIYEAKYCVGCELEKQDSDLENGKCPLHPLEKLQSIEEENYFFKFSKFQDRLLEVYKRNPQFIIPGHRQKEIENFVKSGLQDFSVSRLKEKMPWGIPVPNDDKHVMYVWFDALTNYISALGWPENTEGFSDFWGTSDKPNAVQIAGKDNLRQQSAMWQAMLMAADLPPSKQIVIHGFITSNGLKMSKSIGNVIDPIEYVKKYGTDSLRYFLLSKISPFEDSDFTKDGFEQAYQSDLANGLGNLVARVAGLAKEITVSDSGSLDFSSEVKGNIDKYEFNKALDYIWGAIKNADVMINTNEVWKLSNEAKKDIIQNLVNIVRQIAYDLKPFLPETSERITQQFSGTKIDPEQSLFPRLDNLK